MRYKSVSEIIRNNKGRFEPEKNLPINDRNWLYQKYVVELLSWSDFYQQYNISPALLNNRLKRFNITRIKPVWNSGTKGLCKSNSGSFKPGAYGPDSGNWKGGVASENTIVRGSPEYKEWRKKVFERDKNTCVNCGVNSEKDKKVILQADHIKPFAFFPNLRFEVENGRVLCIPCHKKTPTFKKRKI